MISSMLGGIIYFADNFRGPMTAVKLKQGTEYGLFKDGECVIRYDLAPFCEIVTPRTILIGPSDLVRSLPNVSEASERLDFCAGDTMAVFRVIFDVQLPGHTPDLGNPMFLEYDFFDALMLEDEPSSSRFLC
jgi:hypothetical protein